MLQIKCKEQSPDVENKVKMTRFHFILELQNKNKS